MRQDLWRMASSDVLLYEANQIREITRRHSIHILPAAAKVSQPLTQEVEARANTLTALGFKPLDALHLASAEAIKATLFLTTDDRLPGLANRHASTIQVNVANPAKTDIFAP